MNDKMRPLETERLVLREIKETDASLIVRLRSEPTVYQYFLSPKPITRESHLKWYYNNYKEDKNRIDFIVIEKGSRDEKGVFNIKRDSNDMCCSEIGYLLDKSARGKGYAQEGIKRLMIFAEKEWKCNKIVFHIHKKNKTSRVLAERLGYTEIKREGDFVVYQINLENFEGGGINFDKIYAGKEAA